MRYWDWQTDIISETHFEFLDYHDPHYSSCIGYGTYYSESTKHLFREDEIRLALYELTEDELKVCLLHQPFLMSIIVWIMNTREQITAYEKKCNEQI